MTIKPITSAPLAQLPLPLWCDSGITSWTITNNIAPAAAARPKGSKPVATPISATPSAAATGDQTGRHAKPDRGGPAVADTAQCQRHHQPFRHILNRNASGK